jgi:hypothetical protein
MAPVRDGMADAEISEA